MVIFMHKIIFIFSLILKYGKVIPVRNNLTLRFALTSFVHNNKKYVTLPYINFFFMDAEIH